jgi:hypothetical protein
MTISEYSSGVPPVVPCPKEAFPKDSRMSRLVQLIESIWKDLCELVSALFQHSEAEWKPMEDSIFQAVIRETIATNQRHFMVPEQLLSRDASMETLSDLEKQDLLETIDCIKKDFFHKCLDSLSLAPSSLEGNTLTQSLFGFLADLICWQKKHPENADIANMQAVFKETYFFAVHREAISRLIKPKEQEKRKIEYVEKIHQKLASLKDGERFVYAAQVSHHAILFDFTVHVSEEVRSVDIKVINSGQGVEHHHSNSFLSDLNPFAKYQSYLIEGANLDTVLQSDFIKNLIEEDMPDEVKGAKIPLLGYIIRLVFDFYQDVSGVDHVYKLLNAHVIDHASGKLIISDDPRMTHSPQKNGVCSRKIYQYWMKENLPDRTDYQRYKSETAKFALDRVKIAHALEKRLDARCADVDSLKDRLFVKPHWFSLVVARLRNDMKTRTMELLGETIVQKAEAKLVRLEEGNNG